MQRLERRGRRSRHGRRLGEGAAAAAALAGGEAETGGSTAGRAHQEVGSVVRVAEEEGVELQRVGEANQHRYCTGVVFKLLEGAHRRGGILQPGEAPLDPCFMLVEFEIGAPFRPVSRFPRLY